MNYASKVVRFTYSNRQYCWCNSHLRVWLAQVLALMLGLAFFDLLSQHEWPSIRITLGTSTSYFWGQNSCVGGGTNRLPNALPEQPCYNLTERSRLPRCKKATQLVRIVEWLLFCAPYRQKLFSSTKPISEKCSYQWAQKTQNCWKK